MSRSNQSISNIPVIDIFAGSGGLGEGFVRAGFNVKLSIESDEIYCETLRIRRLFHILERNKCTEKYFSFLPLKL